MNFLDGETVRDSFARSPAMKAQLGSNFGREEKCICFARFALRATQLFQFKRRQEREERHQALISHEKELEKQRPKRLRGIGSFQEEKAIPAERRSFRRLRAAN